MNNRLSSALASSDPAADVSDSSLRVLSLPLSQGEVLECTPCVDRLCQGLLRQRGVTQARVNPRIGQLTVDFDADTVSPDVIRATADQLTSDLASRFRHHTFTVRGMDCPNCASGLEEMARHLPGVESASVHFATARMRVELESGHQAALPHLQGQAKEMGFILTDDTVTAAPLSQSGTWIERFTTPTAQASLSFGLLCLGAVCEHGFHSPAILTNALYILSILSGGYRFARAAASALRNRIVSTHLLMTLAALGALLSGHAEEAAMVISLYAIGLALENAAMQRTRQSLRDLIDAAPASAIRLLADGVQETIPADSLRISDITLILPGARVPADGVIVSGESHLTEAAITGESLPRQKSIGDKVFAGTVNGEGSLQVRVNAPASDSTLARILQLVEEAQSEKAATQSAIERFGRIYTPVVLALAVAVALLGPLVAPGVSSWYMALTLLVVACPCALVIATPVAYVSGISRAAHLGILIKGGLHLENLAAAREIYFDKTGTLTTGHLAVASISPASVLGETDLLTLAASIEAHSEHPVANAILRRAREHDISLFPVGPVRAVPGRGVQSSVENRLIRIGNRAFLTESGIQLPESTDQNQDESTLLFIGRDTEYLGSIAVTDTLRPESAQALAALHRQRLTTALLTGDRKSVAEKVGATVGIQTIYADLLPQEKQQIVRDSKNITAFVGDGINDAPALASATVGIAMGASGTAAAVEAADIALMRSDLSLLPDAISLARATHQTVRINIAIAVGAVIVLLIGTLLGKLTLPLSVLGHEGSALIVILNGIRLLAFRPRR